MSINIPEIGVHLHGHTLDRPPEILERIMLGDPPDNPGRSTLAICIATIMKAKKLSIGTGSSQAPAPDNRFESEVILEDYVLDKFHLLKEFDIFRGIDLKASKRRIQEIAVVDTESINTATEIQCAARLYRAEGIKWGFFVTDKAHFPRVSDIVRKTFQQGEFENTLQQFFVTASHVPYTTLGETIIIEAGIETDIKADGGRKSKWGKIYKLVSYLAQASPDDVEKIILVLKRLGLIGSD